MSDWIGEFNLSRIVQAAKRGPGQPMLVDARLPGTCGASSTSYRCAPRRCPREGAGAESGLEPLTPCLKRSADRAPSVRGVGLRHGCH
jgi:hypothetical protein